SNGQPSGRMGTPLGSNKSNAPSKLNHHAQIGTALGNQAGNAAATAS
ncbi:hypothetical protein PSYJA_43301, partial [Pseudomonas syringae pv. japonica str. M301072]